MTCKQCGFTAPDMSGMMSHIRQNHGWNTNKKVKQFRTRCKLCNKRFANFSKLRKHQWSTHPEIYAKKTGQEVSVRSFIDSAQANGNTGPEMTVSQLLTHLQSQSDFLTKAIALIAGVASHHEEVK